MNEIMDKFLLHGNKFTPEVHLRQPEFTYSACWSFTKNKKRIQESKLTGNLRYTYQIESDKSRFRYGMTFEDFHDFPRKATSAKILCEKTFNITKNLKYYGYHHRVTSVVYKFFNNMTSNTNKQI